MTDFADLTTLLAVWAAHRKGCQYRDGNMCDNHMRGACWTCRREYCPTFRNDDEQVGAE